ncbi:hypothetical protein LJC04_02495 [Ruminococcaceae bacterium OttesenSCG-928-O06]|nr:hypothetical protein [Ruminococcaceae bacterium OttesenSCG-928-O06]
MRAFLYKANTSVAWRVVWCIVFALPVPISLLSVIGSLLSLSMITGDWSTLHGVLMGVSAQAFMVLAATYWIVYLVALVMVLVRKKIGWPGLLPIFHIVLFALALAANILAG